MKPNWIDSDEHGRLVTWIVAEERHSEERLQPIFSDMTASAAVYHGRAVDPRLPHERWRSNLNAPYGYSGVETGVAAELDILLAPDPWVQAEGLGGEDQKTARVIEKLIQHTLTVNDWPKLLQLAIRERRVFGTSILKVDWGPRYSRLWVEVSQSDLDAWELQVQIASAATGMPAPDPDDDTNSAFPGESRMLFSAWRDIVSKAGYGVSDKPRSGWQNVLRMRAPRISQVPIFETRFDPRIPDVQDQPVFMQRIVVTKRWLMERATDDPNSPLPFSKEAVERAIGGAPADFSNWDQAISRMLDVPDYRSTQWSANEIGEQPVELFEVWRRNSEMPYVVLMNRTTIVNRDPHSLPHRHGMLPYVALRNNPQPGMFCGMSDLRQTKGTYAAMNRMLNLYIDALTLDVTPIYIAAKSAGLPEDTELNFRPGAIWRPNMPDQVRPLMKETASPDVFRFIELMERLSDDTMSTPRQLRGAMSTVGRVSATESERRFSQGLARQKMSSSTTETELRPLIHQILFLWADHGAVEDRVNIGGRDLGLDALGSIDRARLIQALDQDFRFRGATLSVNRAERVAFLERFLGTGVGVQALAPQEARAILSMMWREGGMPGNVITEDGNQFVAARMARELQNAQALSEATQDIPGQPLPDSDAEFYDSTQASIDPVGGGLDPTMETGASTTPFA